MNDILSIEKDSIWIRKETGSSFIVKSIAHAWHEYGSYVVYSPLWDQDVHYLMPNYRFLKCFERNDADPSKLIRCIQCSHEIKSAW